MVKSISKLICVCIHNIHIHTVDMCMWERQREKQREDTEKDCQRGRQRQREWDGWVGLRGEGRTNHLLEQISVEYDPHLLGEWIEDRVAKAKAIHLLAPTAPQRSPEKTLPHKTHLCEWLQLVALSKLGTFQNCPELCVIDLLANQVPNLDPDLSSLGLASKRFCKQTKLTNSLCFKYSFVSWLSFISNASSAICSFTQHLFIKWLLY